MAVSESRVRYTVIIVLVAAAFDSLVKEMLWVPLQVKQMAFFAIPPVMFAGIFLLVPYAAERVAILSSGTARRYLLNGYVGLAVVMLVTWVVLAYQAISYGSVNTNISLFLKDLVVVSGAGVSLLLLRRLFRWYRRTKNRVVLLLGTWTLGYIIFYTLHIFADYLGRPSPPSLLNGIAAGFLLLLWSAYAALLIMTRTYNVGLKVVGALLVSPVLITGWELILRLGIPLDIVTRSILNLGLILSPLAYMFGFLFLVPALPNPTAGGYYRSLAYSLGIGAATSCGMGLALPITFPLSGYASLMLIVPATVLQYAGFASCAAYFSIDEDVRKQIRRAVPFMASIGEAEAGISTEQQVKGFYDRFSGLAKESGAVEDSALTEQDIYSYVSALKKMQKEG